MPPLKIVFAGTPAFAATHLKHICEQSNHQVCAVYTQPDRPKGRGKKLIPSAVKEYALSKNISVFQPLSLKEDEQQSLLASQQADIMVVVAYGLILPVAILETPRLGCINVHGSILPRWRGAAPIERAIEAGDKSSGITIMQMAEGLDDGDMLVKGKLDIHPECTGDELRMQLAHQGCDLLIQTLDNIGKDEVLTPEAQDHSLANYASKLKKAESQINWQLDAQTIHNKIRAFNSQNICQSTVNDQIIKFWKTSVLDINASHSAGKIIAISPNGIDIACGKNAIRIHELQFPGKKAMSAKDILNGRRDFFKIGDCFMSTLNP